jgi:hypothetical protein
MNNFDSHTLEELIIARNKLNDTTMTFVEDAIKTEHDSRAKLDFALQLSELQLVNNLILVKFVERFDVGYELLN